MGDYGDDAPTELGAGADETYAVTAWSDYQDDEEPLRRRVTPSWVVATAVAASILAAVGAGAVAIDYFLLRHREQPAPPAQPSMVQAAPPLTVTTTPAAATISPPAPLPQLTKTVTAAPKTIAVPVADPAPRFNPGTYSTYVSWVGAPCIDVRSPNGPLMPVATTCVSGEVDVVHHIVRNSGEWIGADPIMGQASGLACKVVADATGAVLYADSGAAGDGHDVNCIIKAP